jgi:hypothetical protein
MQRKQIITSHPPIGIFRHFKCLCDRERYEILSPIGVIEKYIVRKVTNVVEVSQGSEFQNNSNS